MAKKAYEYLMSIINQDENPTHCLALDTIRNLIGADMTQNLIERGMIEIAGRYGESGAICCKIW